jgi:hypothetical protein
MPSVLGPNLLDNLIGSVVDPLRAQLYPLLGNKQHQVHLVRRTWSGGARGSGTATVTVDVTITPAPAVQFENDEQAQHYELEGSGRSEEGHAVVSEVSLQYTEADLTGGAIAVGDEFYYRIVDGQGQSIQNRYYVLDRPPVPDREKTIGWMLWLRRVQVDES